MCSEDASAGPCTRAKKMGSYEWWWVPAFAIRFASSLCRSSTRCLALSACDTSPLFKHSNTSFHTLLEKGGRKKTKNKTKNKKKEHTSTLSLPHTEEIVLWIPNKEEELQTKTKKKEMESVRGGVVCVGLVCHLESLPLCRESTISSVWGSGTSAASNRTPPSFSKNKNSVNRNNNIHTHTHNPPHLLDQKKTQQQRGCCA